MRRPITGRRIFRINSICLPSRLLEATHQQQDQQDHDNQAETAAAVVTGAVERAAADAAETAEQGDDQNNQDDGANGHGSNLRKSETLGAVRRAGTTESPG